MVFSVGHITGAPFADEVFSPIEAKKSLKIFAICLGSVINISFLCNFILIFSLLIDLLEIYFN